MADNEWMSGYLEAVLSNENLVLSQKKANGILEAVQSSEILKNPDQSQLATRYFIKELVAESSAENLSQIWHKATLLAKSEHERAFRTENFCWRMWYICQKQAVLNAAEKNRHHARKMQKEVVENEEDDRSLQTESESLDFQVECFQGSDIADSESSKNDNTLTRKHYIVLISLHGLVRGHNMELGRDSDTGGQVKYVVELARALSSMPEVYRVDLLTRQITSPEVDSSYGEPIEMLTSNLEQFGGESSGAYIARIPCGPREEYIKKELLWPTIHEFVDGCLSHILHMSNVLREEINGPNSTDPVWPYVIHGHYADAGSVAALLSGALNVPMVMTGHSLGRNKLEQLLKQGRLTMEDINSTFKIGKRIEAEERSLDAAELVVCSTKQEIAEQWEMYDGFSVRTAFKLKKREEAGKMPHGRCLPKMAVIPPGMEFDTQEKKAAMAASKNGDSADSHSPSPTADPPIWAEIGKFLANPSKPIVLALARPDPKKNIPALVKAYGECKPLRDVANLVLVLGNRTDIDEMPRGNADVLTSILKLIDKYELYGSVAYPKKHKQSDVASIYSLAAKSKGVFVNPALQEPFGLTLIEAAARGLPVVATKNGGPVDIVKVLRNGVLVDPYNCEQIGESILGLITDRQSWEECRLSGLKHIDHYSWPGHCRVYLSSIARCRNRHPNWKGEVGADAELESASLNSMPGQNDVSLAFSIESKTHGSSSLRSPADLERFMAEHAQQQQQGRPETGLEPALADPAGVERAYLELRHCSRLVFIAVDSYDSHGWLTDTARDVLKFAISEAAGRTKLAISTAMNGAEMVESLMHWAVDLSDILVIVAGSGSEIYYVVNGQLVMDADYEAHVAYRWGDEGLRRTMQSLVAARSQEAAREVPGSAAGIVEDRQRNCSRRLAYKLQGTAAPVQVDVLRKSLRLRGYRCNVVCCRGGTALHLLPLHASRAQALRYLFVRVGVRIEKMVVILAPGGDSDVEEMVGGLHTTVFVHSKTQAGSGENGAKNGRARVHSVANVEDNLYELKPFVAA